MVTLHYYVISSDIGIIIGRHFIFVVVNGYIPLRRIFISSIGYLGEERIYPSFLVSQLVLQQRVIYPTL